METRAWNWSLELNESLELESLDNDIFEFVQSLEYLNLRHNYINSIDVNLINQLENLEFLSMINGYYDSHDEFSFDFETLNLPRLKYLAVRSDRVPVLKNLNLKFLEVKGLKDLGFENLSSQTQLKGLNLVFNYETSQMPVIEESIFKCLENLEYLSFRFDYIFGAQQIIDDKEFYKNLINAKEAKVYHNFDDFSYQHCLFMFTVSHFLYLFD